MRLAARGHSAAGEQGRTPSPKLESREDIRGEIPGVEGGRDHPARCIYRQGSRTHRQARPEARRALERPPTAIERRGARATLHARAHACDRDSWREGDCARLDAARIGGHPAGQYNRAYTLRDQRGRAHAHEGGDREASLQAAAPGPEEGCCRNHSMHSGARRVPCEPRCSHTGCVRQITNWLETQAAGLP